MMNSEAMALFLDFEKAYDRVVWDYLFLILAVFGFGPRFILWIRLLYTKPLALILLNGFLLQPLEVTRGVKQGDPLSSLLFLLSIEPLGNLIRSRADLGVSITRSKSITGLYFADDSTLVSKHVNGIRQQLEQVQIYCQGSGARLNLRKSALMPLNRRQTSPTIPEVKCLGPSDLIKYLGIPFGRQVSKDTILEELNNKFYRGFGIWGRRTRTLRGRLLLVHTMILSVLWHFTPHTTVPPSCVRRWQRMLNKFVLTRKNDQDSNFVQLAPNELLYLPSKKGGLQLPHLQTQLKTQRLQLLQQFVNVLLKSKDEMWPLLASSFFVALTPSVPVKHPLHFLDISPTKLKYLLHLDVLPEWWREIWRVWHSVQWPAKGGETSNTTALLYAPMWL